MILLFSFYYLTFLLSCLLNYDIMMLSIFDAVLFEGIINRKGALMKLDNVKRFDMQKKPIKQRWYLTPISWLLSFGDVWRHKLKITKTNMKGLKPPYILLCTHMSFIDFKVTTAALFPRRANYIVAIDGFLINEWLLRNVGCICKRKFTNDITLVRHIKYALEVNKTVVAIYPEARYSLIGTTAILPESLGKMIKLLKYPVVMLNMHGNYLTSPVWNLPDRKSPLKADMTQIITKEDVGILDVATINKRIETAFEYDEYRWQKENNIKITYPNRAKGLHQVLYLCPACHTEHQMNSDKDELWCEHCKKVWKMTELGELEAVDGHTEFSHIPDWYEYERAMVRKEIEEGRYHFKDQVMVDALPNAKGYIRLGEATLEHTSNGFHLYGTFDEEPFSLIKEPLSMYSCHIEYDYMGRGDCLDLSTLEDTYYLYPLTQKNVVTKLHFATEEIYKIAKAAHDAKKT